MLQRPSDWPLQSRVASHSKHFPLVPDRVCLVPDALPEKHCKQILITLAAACGERHILLLGQPIFQLRSLQLPHPLHCPRKCTGGHASHQSGLPTFKAPQGGAPLAPVAFPPVPPLLPVTASDSSLLSLKLILQLLSLAQAADDYLKPQPFIYEKREPDIILIDCHLLNIKRGQRKQTRDPLCVDNGVIFRCVSLFTPLSN